MGGKGDVPSPPDYAQTAQLQGELNKEAVTQQTWANRPTQITPWGGVDWRSTYAFDPATGEKVTQWTQEQTLDPRLQRSLEAQMGVGEARAGLAQDIQQGRLEGAMGTPIDWGQFSGIPGIEAAPELRERAEEAAYGRATGRLDPMWNERQQQMEIKLRNQGLRPGDEAWDRAMANLNRARTDAYAVAEQEATAAGRAESDQMFRQQQAQQQQAAALRQYEIAEELQRRGMPLNEINMLLAGQGVQPPAAPGYGSAGMATPADMMRAAGLTYGAQADAYNAQQAQRQGLFSGLMQGASLIPMAAQAGMFSDRRFKTYIEQVGTWRGYPWYRFKYVWGDWGEGVMADEVNPEAVSHIGGFAFVDYSRVR